MQKKSLGGIGKLYDERNFLSDVYYNINPRQSEDKLTCVIVLMGTELELPIGRNPVAHSPDRTDDVPRYRIFLEDGRYLLVTIDYLRSTSPTPYLCTSCDGIFHAELAPTFG